MIIEQPEWLPNGQKDIGTALNHAATDWASGRLMSVAIVGETVEGNYKFWATEPEDLLKFIGFCTALVNYLSHQVPFEDGDDEEEDDDEEGVHG